MDRKIFIPEKNQFVKKKKKKMVGKNKASKQIKLQLSLTRVHVKALRKIMPRSSEAAFCQYRNNSGGTVLCLIGGFASIVDAL